MWSALFRLYPRDVSPGPQRSLSRRPLVHDHLIVLDGRARSNHVFEIVGQMMNLFIVIAGEAFDGLDRVPIGKNFELGDVVANLAQHLHAPVAGNSRDRANPLLVEVFGVLFGRSRTRLAAPDSGDQSSRLGAPLRRGGVAWLG